MQLLQVFDLFSPSLSLSLSLSQATNTQYMYHDATI